MSETNLHKWSPRSWIVPPGLVEPLKRFDIRCDALIRRYEDGDPRPLLIRGNTGVGKSLFAEYFVHKFLGTPSSLDAEDEGDGPSRVPVFAVEGKSLSVPVKFLNCAALTESLLESELFGHVKGAFTDAKEDRVGLLNSVERGVLVLEEVGEMSKPLQAKLLTAIETRRFTRVGDDLDIELQAQIIATTNVDRRKKLRDDFWYRFESFYVPPIHERRQDILYYIEHFDKGLMDVLTKGIIFSALCYNWPGNVREIERVCNSIREQIIYHEKYTEKLHQAINETDFLYAPPSANKVSFYDLGVSDFRFDSPLNLARRLVEKGCDLSKIEILLNSNDLSFDCYGNKFKSWMTKEVAEQSVVGSNLFRISFIENPHYKLASSGIKVFCALFLQDFQANSDLMNLESELTAPSCYKEYTEPLVSTIGFPFRYPKKLNSEAKKKEIVLAQLFSIFCNKLYLVNFNEVGKFPAPYQEGILEAMKFATGIKSIDIQSVCNLYDLHKRNPRNAFLASYFEADAEAEVEEIPIDQVSLDELVALYYETLCNQVGTSHGFQKRLAEMLGVTEGTIHNHLKKHRIKEKFNKLNFHPQKRLSILKPK